METSTSTIIILGTAFTLLILALTMIIVVTGQKKKSMLELQVQRMELDKQKEISENTLITQEKERQRVGLELHDELGPTFAAIRLNVDRMQQKVKNGKEKEIPNLAQQTSEALEIAISQFSDISKLLYPVILNRHGLRQAVQDLIDKADFEKHTNFTIDMNFDDSPKEIINLTVYRVCQELITNARKHANATIVHLDVLKKNDQIHIAYTDNGKGFDNNKDYTGLGLNSIKGRVEAVGGSVETDTAINKGVNYLIDMPYD